MTCPRCHFENRNWANFCSRCGLQLGMICTKCSHLCPLGSIYCERCGVAFSLPANKLSENISISEKINKLQRYLPQGLSEKVLSNRDKIEGEHKNVTVLFCDMVDFTPVVEKLGSEKAYTLMDRIYEILIHKVDEYGGTVNEMTGDGIMALFGAPIALEDAPQRAIRSAMSIHREMADFSKEVNRLHDGLPPLRMRIGIHTGAVVVGALGNDLRVEFKAVGDTVNLSARIQSLAEPGTTFVTEDTFKLTEGFFRFEAMGERIIKGKNNSVKVYRVITVGKSRTRFDVSAEKGLTPFIGRDRELELLLDGFERSKEGKGQACSIIAEAGVGKSRLLYEFRKAVANDNITFLEGRCLSYSQGVSYHPIIDVTKQSFDIKDGDSDAEKKEKIVIGLEKVASVEDNILAGIVDVLSIPTDELGRSPLSPEARRNRITQAFTQLVRKGSSVRPLILAFEDLHWVDEGSETILKETLDSVPGARVFLIFTYRPDFIHTWGGRSYHNQLNLNRLSNRETMTLAAHLLAGSKIDQKLEKMILEKTEGIPFYIEELIHSLKYQESIRKIDNQYTLVKTAGDLLIPSSINDVIMTRVDSLSDGAKILLQAGSVIGREFSHDLIRMVAGISDEELWSHLSALKDAELLYERGVYPQSTYVFKHALTRDVAYNSLLRKRKKEIHKDVGEVLEQLNIERLSEVCEVLALHFLNGEDWKRAYRYCFDAAIKTFSHSAFEEAKRYVEDALRAIQKLPRDRARIEQEIDLCFYMRSVLVPLGRHNEWGEWIHTAELLAREIGDDARLSNVLNYLSSLHWIQDQPGKAIELGQQALIFANETKHFSYQTAIMHHLGIYYFTVGDFAKQVEYHREVCQRLTGENAYLQHGLSTFPGAWVRSILALGMAELGIFDEIDKLAKDSLTIAREVENALTLIATHSFIGNAYLMFGEPATALEHLKSAYKVCLDSKAKFLHAYSAGSLGNGYLNIDEPEKALPILKKGTDPEHIERGVWTVHPFTILAEVYRCTGQNELAMDTISKALKLARESGEQGFEAWAMLTMARVHLDEGREEKAWQWYKHAIHKGISLSMQPLVAICYKEFRDASHYLESLENAQSDLIKAEKMYRTMIIAAPSFMY